MTEGVLFNFLLLGFETSLTIGLPAVLVGIAWKLIHMWN